MNQSIHKIQAARRHQRRLFMLAALGITAITVIIFAFLIFTNGIKLKITPQDASDNANITVVSGFGVILGHDLYSLTNAIIIRVAAPGFLPEVITAKSTGQANFIEIYLKEAPARLILSTIPAKANSRWLINGELAAVARSYTAKLARGSYAITVDNPYFYPVQRQITLKAGQKKSATIKLKPVTGAVAIKTTPAGATITINQNSVGLSPQTEQLFGGKYNITITHPAYQTINDTIEITNSRTMVARNYNLVPKQAVISFNLTPAKGILMLDGLAIPPKGRLAVTALTKHTLFYSKAGYVPRNLQFSVAPNSSRVIKLTLNRDMGTLQIRNSQNALVLVNGHFRGLAPLNLKLPTVPQMITVTKAGYRLKRVKITPDSHRTKRINITLITELKARLAESPKLEKLREGITLALFIPNNFEMGAPRSEPGQRANEFQKSVILTKAFYASLYEITVSQFNQFTGRATVKKTANLPVTNITWTEAAQFCNWLSRKEGLKPVYHFRGNKLVSVDINGDGYRLPTEAEWEWLARKAGRAHETRFPWGNSSIIPKSTGNFADESAKNLVKTYIPDYNDGYKKLAPVGRFNKNASGLYDLAGNVSEWVHDYYRLTPPDPGRIFRNPSGPATGQTHVVKGSSWRSGTVTELRGAYRDTSAAGRDDLGFRVVRYLYGKEK